MSFINLMADDIWSESDIVNRTEAMIAAEFPVADQLILNRKVTAVAAGFYALTEEETAEVTEFNILCMEARQAGIEARNDMALLLKVLAYEAGEASDDEAVLQLVALRAEQRAPTVVEEPVVPDETPL